jgi:cytoskeletal protein CcmA (bactofilin family)
MAAGPQSVISRGICLEGELEGQESLIVEGRFKGRVETQGDVIVAAGSHIEAVISARNITILGRVDGNIEAREAVEIQQEGVLIGDCRARTIQIREGARFEGRSDIFK